MSNKRNRRNMWQVIADGIVHLLESERFFQIILGIFILQALWFVFTARYPMAFDEAFHFGLIKLHAQQWMPFFTHQPPGADAYGAVARDPSYLYHYLMSWPYRLISAVTSSQTQQVIFLRLINVAMFVYSIVLFRRLLARLGMSRALNHTALLIYILLPITPFLAATINYDNLFILVSTWSLLATFNWFDALQKRQISVARTAILLCVITLACLIKYAFLPITAAIVLCMAWQLWRARADWPELRVACKQSFRQLSRLKVVGLVLFVLISLFLFTERYGVNLVRYHELNVSCGSVLSVQSCSQYGPWARDHGYILGKSSAFKPRVLWYIGDWIAGMWKRTFFAINYNYANKWPLPIPSITTIVLGVGSLLVFLFAGRKVFRKQSHRQIAALVTVLYVGALFLQDFQSYVQTGVAVAVNGRYLLPFMPIIFVFAGLGIRHYWRKFQVLKPFLTVMVILLFLQGGGVLTFIVQSDKSWDWPNQGVIDVNNGARNVLQPFIVGARNKN